VPFGACPEIAEMLSEPLGTVKGRMRLGMDKIRATLAEGW
jgi:DNA-directed RNA polymerase specialized sigma24 family protein